MNLTAHESMIPTNKYTSLISTLSPQDILSLLIKTLINKGWVKVENKTYVQMLYLDPKSKEIFNIELLVQALQEPIIRDKKSFITIFEVSKLSGCSHNWVYIHKSILDLWITNPEIEMKSKTNWNFLNLNNSLLDVPQKTCDEIKEEYNIITILLNGRLESKLQGIIILYRYFVAYQNIIDLQVFENYLDLQNLHPRLKLYLVLILKDLNTNASIEFYNKYPSLQINGDFTTIDIKSLTNILLQEIVH